MLAAAGNSELDRIWFRIYILLVRGRPRPNTKLITGDDPANTGDVHMSWLILLLAGLLETVWAVGLKYTHGFTRPLPTIGTLVAMTASVWLLSIAVKNLPLGTAYAMWTGIGAVGAVILGIILFQEPVTAARIGCVALILAGLLGLRLTA